MKKMNNLALLAGSMLAVSAHAQSSVTLYGLLDVGVGYVSNEGGKANYKMLSGTSQNGRWGVKGTEDLGGGWSTVFTLENGFDITSGKFQQGGREFGRQAFVGLSDKTYGTVTFGRQYDAIWDVLTQFSPTSTSSDLSFHIGDNDNLNGGFRYSNAVKYSSPLFYGFRAEALYAFSNAAGQFANNRATSFGLSYANGPVTAGLAYIDIDQPGTGNPSGAVSDDYAGAPFQLFHSSPLNSTVGVARQRVFGAGGAYRFGQASINGVVTDTRYSYLDGTGLHLTNYDVSMTYYLTPSLQLAGGYIYTNGKYSGFTSNPHWNTLHTSIDYFLSKRTDVDLQFIYTKANGGRADIWLQAPSTANNQSAVFATLRHKF